MANKTQVKIVNCETGEEVFEDASKEQIAEFAQIAKDKATAQALAAAKEAAKLAILDRIGLTADELKTILG
jgi:uncharacterized protein (UPF0264 family)